jgi:hypothetical protein
MRNPKELALAAIIESLEAAGLDVTSNLRTLVEDLIGEQWESRNRDRFPGKDEAALLKLVRDFVAQQENGAGR